MDAHWFACVSGRPLIAHLTIMWCLTAASDDPDGSLFSDFRNRFGKRLKRLGVHCGLTAIWVLEKQVDKYADQRVETVHAHMLFHLPEEYRSDANRNRVEDVVEQLVERVADGPLRDRAFRLTFPKTPDGLYLLKAGTEAVLDAYSVPRDFCKTRGEGVIDAKRCGATQNLGPAARHRWKINIPEQGE